jgi:hypothetical protein
MQLAAIFISVVALSISLFAARGQIRTARQANTVPVLVDLFREHRSDRLAEARRFVNTELANHDLSRGLEGLPHHERLLIRDLAWFYDNLGALVAHNIVDIHPVSGYLGGAAVNTWTKMEPLILAERENRVGLDPSRWQMYFENLCKLIEEIHRQLPAQKISCGDWRPHRIPAV